MNITYRDYLINEFHIAPEVLEAVDAAEKKLADRFAELDDVCAICNFQYRSRPGQT